MRLTWFSTVRILLGAENKMCAKFQMIQKKLDLTFKYSQRTQIEHFVKFEFDQVRQSWFSTMKIFLGAEN